MSGGHYTPAGFAKTSTGTPGQAQLDDDGNLKVNVVAGGTGGSGNYPATRTASGTLTTPGDTLTISTVGMSTVAISLSGISSGIAIQWLGEVAGKGPVSVKVTSAGAFGSPDSFGGTTSVGKYLANVAGYSSFTLSLAAISSGSVIADMTADPIASGLATQAYLADPLSGTYSQLTGAGRLTVDNRVEDGSDVAQGSTGDSSSADTVIGLLKNVKGSLAAPALPTGAATAALQQYPLSQSTFFPGTGSLVLNLTRPCPTTAVVFLDNGTGAGAATFVIEGSPDSGTTYVGLWAFPIDGTASTAPKYTQSISMNTSPGTYLVNTSGYTNVRVRCTAFSSGLAFPVYMVAYPQSVGVSGHYVIGADHTTAAKVFSDGSIGASLTTGIQAIAYGAGGEGGSNTLRVSIADGNAPIGSVTETAPATDIASSGLNGRLQRIAQRLTTAIASLVSIDTKLPTVLAPSGGLKVDNTSYTTNLDFVAGTNPIYIGFAVPASLTSAAVWQIRKLTYDGSSNLTNIQYAAGTTAFTSIWDNRAVLSYS